MAGLGLTTVAERVTSGLAASVRLSRGSLDLDVCLSLGMGEVVALLGPNGAGKTTLLRALAGLDRLGAGSVVLDGHVLEDVDAGVRVPPEDRPVGVVFQDYLLFPHLSALDNVAFGLRSRGVAKVEARRRARGWLERMGLADRAASRPKDLSGGQAQRVALARALAVEPRLLLLDEPLAALDARTRVDVRRELRRHLSSFPGVRLLVTHDPLEAVSLADVLVVLEDGRVVQTGSVAEISARPRSRYIAELVGVNLFAGRARGDHVMLDSGSFLAVPQAGTGAVFVVVHPRAVCLYRRQPDGTRGNVWPGVVEALDLEGERVRVRVGGAIPIVSEITPVAVSDLGLADGGEVWVSVKASEVTVYPA
ncbi:MAG: ABC transporter ATP-binding protein [Actinomycetota bacterium]|nr:ABC transporter ATP-binding protein [Actinomycetota bacterium]